MVTLLAMCKDDSHPAAYIGGAWLAALASCYDWCYPKLTDTQRRDLIEWMKASPEYSHLRNTSARAYIRNDGAVVDQWSRSRGIRVWISLILLPPVFSTGSSFWTNRT